MKNIVCPRCNGTGEIIEFEIWEQIHHINDGFVALAEASDLEVVSLDIEGSYPVVVTKSPDETVLEAVEDMVRNWPFHGADILMNPANGKDGFYHPPDPRFYDRPAIDHLFDTLIGRIHNEN